MATVKLNPGSSEDKPYFWRRLFSEERNNSREVFDWVFGVVLPTACVYFDPMVFSGEWIGDQGMMESIRPFAYTLSFISILFMAAWLLWGGKLGAFNALLAGLFFFGGFVSLMVGIVLIPFSLIGLFILIGILGFTPLFSALVYLRNARTAFDMARPYFRESSLVSAVLFAVLLSAALPLAVNSHVEREIKLVEKGSQEEANSALERLRNYGPLVDIRRMERESKKAL